MATAEQDYYELLGVARDASHTEIKSAFRRLARELHPDVSDDPNAGPRFRAVAEAYEVLADPERRQLYDRFGHAVVRGGGFAPMTDFGSLSDVFAAFFGETLFGTAGQSSRGPARGPDLAARVTAALHAWRARETERRLLLGLNDRLREDSGVGWPAPRGAGS